MDENQEKLLLLKQKIEKMINEGFVEEAKENLNKYEKLFDEEWLLTTKSVIFLVNGEAEVAENILKSGLMKYPLSTDVLFNLGYIKEIKGDYQSAYDFYLDAHYFLNKKQDTTAETAIENLKKVTVNLIEKKKIVFFVKQNMDSFVNDIIFRLSDEFRVRKIIVTNYKQIDYWMEWADICWFEWCDDLIIYGSKLELRKNKKIICRLHSYEAFTNYIYKVNWANIDQVIFVADHIRKLVIESTDLKENQTAVIANGINYGKFDFRKRAKGNKIAYVGYINYKKGPMLLLQLINELSIIGNDYELYIAGEFQDKRYYLYFKQMIEEFGLENKVFFNGWQEDINTWLEDKNYIVSTSLLESQHLSIMEAMAKGIKPLVHNFVGAKQIYPSKYVWNTIPEAVNMIISNEYNSEEYRLFIEKSYSLEKQIVKIKKLLQEGPKNKDFDYSLYWNTRLNQKFDIEGVGYLGLGEIYNKYLYKSRIETLEKIEKSIFQSFNGKRILEIGPGIGVFTELFHDRKPLNYVGIDISQRSVSELSIKYGQFHFINGDISNEEIYPKTAKFDFVFGADVLLHMTDESKYQQTIRNIEKVMSDNGYLVLMDPITITGAKSESRHVVIRELEYVENMLDNVGLEVVTNLSTTLFMNYPFDNKVLGKEKGKLVLDIFNKIRRYFSLTLKHQNKQAYYLYLLDKLLLSMEGQGASQRVLVIRKKSHQNNKIVIGDKSNQKSVIVEIEKLRQKSEINCNSEFREIIDLVRSYLIISGNDEIAKLI